MELQRKKLEIPPIHGYKLIRNRRATNTLPHSHDQIALVIFFHI